MLSIMLINAPKIDRIKEPKSALQNPSTLNPGAIHPASISKSALITNVNKPSVKKFIGKVIASIKGRIDKFIKAIIITTNNAAKKFATEIPGTIQAVKISAKAKRTHFKIRYINFPFLFFIIIKILIAVFITRYAIY